MRRAIATIISIMLIVAITFPVAALSSIAVKSIKLNSSKITLKVGQTSKLEATLTPTNTTQRILSYVTDNKNVASVDSTGVITGVSAGTTVITVYTFNKTIFAKCDVTISKPVTQASSTAKKTKIKIWTVNRHDQVYMINKVRKYNDTNSDGIKIEYSTYADNYSQVLSLADASNELPDIYFDQLVNTNSLLLKNKIVFLDKFMTPEYKARFGSSFVEGINMYKGQIYSLPAIAISKRLVYNRDIFKRVGLTAPPKTVDEMVADAKLISSKLKGEGIYGFALPMSGNGGVGRGFFEQATLSGIGVREGFDYAKGQYDFSVYKPLLAAYRQIFTSDAVFPGTETLTIDPLRAQFANGKIGMYSTWNHSEYGVYTAQFPTKVDWQYAELPTLDGTIKGSKYIANVGVWFEMTTATKDQNKAWKVMQFLYSDDLLAGYSAGGYGLVMVQSALKIAKPSIAITAQPAMALNVNDRVWPVLPTNVVPQGANANDTLGAIFFGKTKDADIDSSLTELSKRYNAAYAKAVSDGKATKILIPGFTAANPVSK